MADNVKCTEWHDENMSDNRNWQPGWHYEAQTWVKILKLKRMVCSMTTDSSCTENLFFVGVGGNFSIFNQRVILGVGAWLREEIRRDRLKLLEYFMHIIWKAAFEADDLGGWERKTSWYTVKRKQRMRQKKKKLRNTASEGAFKEGIY